MPILTTMRGLEGATNPSISAITEYKPIPSGDLEKAYHKYCDELGFTANERGTFGVERKYWELY